MNIIIVALIGARFLLVYESMLFYPWTISRLQEGKIINAIQFYSAW